jgi:hypothetical protein
VKLRASAAKQGRHRCPTPFASALVRVCGDCLINPQRNADMENALTFIAALALWWVLQVWMLPRVVR